MHLISTLVRSLLFLLITCCISMTTGWATTFSVSTTANTGPGSLRQAILDANADLTATAANPHVITITSTGTIALARPFLVLTNHITIQGPGQASLTISGAGTTRIFWLQNGAITIKDVTLADGVAQGGSGGAGGMGAGGAIFMHEGREGGSGSLNVKLINVALNNNKAIGGEAIENVDGHGGGGGLGGSGVQGGGGGVLGQGFVAGGSVEDSPGSSPGGNGGIPIFGNGGSYPGGTGGFGGGGGLPYPSSSDGYVGGTGGFGGGGAQGGYGGYADSDIKYLNGNGGHGGFGGGGGNSPYQHARAGGNGGFGGGGGFPDGGGGFGGGEGGGYSKLGANTYAGGGGMGAGGAIFITSGTLQLVNVSFTANIAASIFNPYGGDGRALGGAIFIFNKVDNGGQSAPGTTNDPSVSGCNITFTNNEAIESINETVEGIISDPNDMYGTVSDVYGTISGYTGIAIAQQPLSSTAVCVGGSATTSVAVNGAGPFSYQWYKDGQSLGAAQRSSTLSLTNVQRGHAGSYAVVITGECTSLTSTAFSLTVNSLHAVGISPNTATLTCATPVVSLTASGGASYLWSTGATSAVLAVSMASTYSVTVTDRNGCTSTASAYVSGDLSAPIAGISPSTATLSCTNPTAALTATGGGTYLWDNQSTGATREVNAAGTYSVTVTSANGCTATATASVQLNGPTPVSITGLNAAYCQDASAVRLTGAPSGGSFTVDGSLATHLTPAMLNTGSHMVVYSYTNVSGCVGTSAVIVQINALPQVSITASSTAINVGQVVTLTASGGTFVWSTTATTDAITVQPQITTPYSVTVTNASGCTGSASVTINVTVSSSLQLTGPARLCVKTTPPEKAEITLPLTMTLVGGSAPFTYNWAYKAPASTSFKAIAPGGTSIGKINLVHVAGKPTLSIIGTKGNLNGLQGYVMQLTVTDRNGLSTSATTLLDGSCAFGSGARLGVEPQVESLQVRLFPNPVVEALEVEVRGLATPARVALYDLEGRVQQQWNLLPVEGVGTLRASVSALPEGLYILGIETSQGVIHRQRVLKQR